MPLDPATCKHDGLYWYAAPADEKGWRCADCGWQPGEDPGYSPQHDRSHLSLKVGCIIQDLHDREIIYVSNGTCGEVLTSQSVALCIERRLYDSVSIARVVLELEADDEHAKFWRDRGEGIVAGADPRHRCACGKLANVSTSEGGGTRACSHEHLQIALGRNPADPW